MAPDRRRTNNLTVALLITVVVVVMLIVSGIIERLAPDWDPLLYTMGAGVVVGLLAAAAMSVIRRRNN